MTRTALYRHLDSSGGLLYVGISFSVVRRTGEHRRDRSWWSEVASITLEWFDSREDAIEAERKAIESESPRYNIAGRQLYRPKRYQPTNLTKEQALTLVNRSRARDGHKLATHVGLCGVSPDCECLSAITERVESIYD